MTEIAITGVGVVSPIGIGIEEVSKSLDEKQTGIGFRDGFENVDSPMRVVASIKNFEGKKFVKPRKSIKVMCRPIQFGFAASSLALEQAGISESDFEPERKATIFGSEAFVADPKELADIFRKCVLNEVFDHNKWGEFILREIEPLWMLKYLPNMVASHVSISFDARGPSNSVCQAEASGSLALIESIDLIHRGTTDLVVAGGTGSSMECTGLLYRGHHRLTKRKDLPENASRPFDKDRDGMVVGEGSGAFVLETLESARSRGANVLATIVGYSRNYCTDKQRFSEAIEKAISIALERAELKSADIGHVNAAGFSTQVDDIAEAKAIKNVLGDCPVFAPKSYYGYVGPAADIIDMATSVISMQRQRIPANLNFETQDPEAPVNLSAEPVEVSSPYFCSIGFSIHGQVTCIVFKAAPAEEA